MRLSWVAVLPAALVVEALRVRLSVQPRRRYWQTRLGEGEVVVVALGDSLTQGIGASRPDSSWLGRFVAHLERGGRRCRVDNRAAYGARVADVLRRQLPVPADAELVTLCIGANDAGRTPPGAVPAAPAAGVCRTPRRRHRRRCSGVQWGPRVSDAAELSEVAREVVTEFPDLRLARVERATAGTRILTELAGDFFHPGDRGHARIAGAFIAAATT